MGDRRKWLAAGGMVTTGVLLRKRRARRRAKAGIIGPTPLATAAGTAAPPSARLADDGSGRGGKR